MKKIDNKIQEYEFEIENLNKRIKELRDKIIIEQKAKYNGIGKFLRLKSRIIQPKSEKSLKLTLNHTKILGHSNDIVDLCDCFVELNGLFPELLDKTDVRMIQKEIKENDNMIIPTIKGCVITEKGINFVATMNSMGDFEL